MRLVHRLLLLRHARAAWARPGVGDADRALTEPGIADAKALGHRMRRAGLVPDVILCSAARRARQTLEHLGPLGPASAGAVTYLESLYGSDAKAYMEAIRAAPPSRSLLVVGHNPMMEDLTLALPGPESGPAAVVPGFPACGLAVIDFEAPFTMLAPAGGRFARFLKPDNS